MNIKYGIIIYDLIEPSPEKKDYETNLDGIGMYQTDTLEAALMLRDYINNRNDGAMARVFIRYDYYINGKKHTFSTSIEK